MRPNVRGTLFRVSVLAYMGLIFFVSSGPIELETLRHAPDYLLHGSAYAVLYLLMHLAVHEGLRLKPGRGAHWLPLVLTVLYGMSDEYHQSFVPGRDASVRDLAADSFGALACMWFCRSRWPAEGLNASSTARRDEDSERKSLRSGG